jgi:hypothetical protein
MSALPASIQTRRAIEDRAAELGAKRTKIQTRMAANTRAMVELLGEARGAGVPLEQLAALLGVSRQTLFNWRELADKARSGA